MKDHELETLAQDITGYFKEKSDNDKKEENRTMPAKVEIVKALHNTLTKHLTKHVMAGTISQDGAIEAMFMFVGFLMAKYIAYVKDPMQQIELISIIAQQIQAVIIGCKQELNPSVLPVAIEILKMLNYSIERPTFNDTKLSDDLKDFGNESRDLFK